jgi:hypothetical protein
MDTIDNESAAENDESSNEGFVMCDSDSSDDTAIKSDDVVEDGVDDDAGTMLVTLKITIKKRK